MLKKHLTILLALLFLAFPGIRSSAADDAVPECTRLDTKASNELLKYSLDGEANGPIFFSGIRCAIEHRNRELCAMEMISFDTTSKVYDYYTTEKIEIGKAYFWFDEQNKDAPVLAFSSKEGAEKYTAEKKSGLVLDYTALTDKILK